MSLGSAPDQELGRRFLQLRPPPGRLLLCAVTGSHLYGFPSPDSDLDLKGVHLAPTRDLLGLGRPAESHDALETFEGIECDLTTNEAGRVLALLLSGNGNMLERIWSPWQICDTPELQDLRRLARGAFSRVFYPHYAGFFRGMQAEHGRADPPRAKTLLYTYRIALTGVHLLRAGEVIADLGRLGPLYGFPEVEEIAARKRASAEHTVLGAEEDTRFRAAWPRLQSMLDEALALSPLPAEPSNRGECAAWLVGLRLRELERTGEAE